ncbi:hypothetical protein HCN44_010551 [Aphidius gifuensis]|uniref:Uncharacterized protein n=1 Tax=Aphidius gifuensis TaxID=684658 RepID=A0A834XTL3_APHGI|nr:lymphocyte antigen 6G [Aphidius gifuensis]KAF7991750.1 hypothetical protein HCN44_010551 [Aphidius gifuensis]
MTSRIKVPPTILATWTVFIIMVLCVAEIQGLTCYKCGLYNEGVGSITPCINSTAQMHLQQCPASAEFCIKYVSEGSTVRDCVGSCVEKEAWSTRTYCCKKDGCNKSGPGIHDTTTKLTTIALGIVFVCSIRG